MAGEADPGQSGANARPSGRNGIIKYGLFAIVVGATAAGGVIGYQRFEEIRKDDQAFQSAQVGGSLDHYTAYLRTNPQGRHVVEANNAIDDVVWKSTPQTLSGLSAYLRRFPNGLHAADATAKSDDLAWAQATSQGSIAAYDNYVQQFPAGIHAAEAENKIAARVSCNTRYAKSELERLKGGSDLAVAGSDGAANIYSTKQGTPRSDTYFNGSSATTYYHDGTYNSQDGIRVNYRIKNNSTFLVYREVAGTVSFRTKAGAFWRGAVGAWLGAAIGGANSADAGQGMKDGAVSGAKAGYAAAQHSQSITVSSPIRPGEAYSGAAYVASSFKVLNSDFKVDHIRAEIDESLLRRKVAPKC